MTSVESGPRPGGRRRAEKFRRKPLPIWLESILLLGLALLLAVVIKSFFVQAFYIPSASMEPGLVENDRILVEKWSYWGSSTPERGDVVVFEDPGGWLPAEDADSSAGLARRVLEKVGLHPTGGHLVKRVIGVAGDIVTCCDEQGRILVNGTPLDEPYLKNSGACNGPMVVGCEWRAGPIPKGHLFVMGDHRDRSADSSYRLCDPADGSCAAGDAYVPNDLVVGRVFVLMWPREHFGWIKRPATFDDLAASK